MCLLINKHIHKPKTVYHTDYNGRVFCTEERKPLYSDKDIIVYKVLKDRLYYSICYSPDTDFMRALRYVTPFMGCTVDFDNDGKADIISEIRFSDDCYADHDKINKGLHSYISYDKAIELLNVSINSDLKIFTAIIPAYTDFYIGEDGDVVSSRLIIYEDNTKINRENSVEIEEFIKNLI